jgi:uncharacterized protein YegL
MNSTEEGGSLSGEQVLPFYIVCDESASMAYNGGIEAINEGLPELHAAIATDPLVSDKSRICLISFSDHAEVLVPLARACDIDQMPGMAERGATNYGEVFRMLQTLIPRDIANLRADGYQVFRPAVFFISDGEPTDSDWADSYADLTDRASNPHAPIFISFGFGDAGPDTMRHIGNPPDDHFGPTGSGVPARKPKPSSGGGLSAAAAMQEPQEGFGAAFIAQQGINPGEALREILVSLTHSIVASTTHPTRSNPSFVIPSTPKGSVPLPATDGGAGR